MPFVQLHVPTSLSPEQVEGLSGAVQRAMIETIDIPPDDFFQAIFAHAPGRLRAHPSYLGVARSEGFVLVRITLARGRSDEKKQALYARIAELASADAGIRAEDVMVVLTENSPADWSFGAGVAQMLDPNVRPHWR